jgi:hypothetical protein
VLRLARREAKNLLLCWRRAWRPPADESGYALDAAGGGLSRAAGPLTRWDGIVDREFGEGCETRAGLARVGHLDYHLDRKR